MSGPAPICPLALSRLITTIIIPSSARCCLSRSTTFPTSPTPRPSTRIAPTGPCQEEIKLIYSLIRPRYAVPVHGEIKHLKAQAKVAQSLGIDKDNIFILSSGDVLELSDSGAKVTGRVPVGAILNITVSLGPMLILRCIPLAMRLRAAMLSPWLPVVIITCFSSG